MNGVFYYGTLTDEWRILYLEDKPMMVYSIFGRLTDEWRIVFLEDLPMNGAFYF